MAAKNLVVDDGSDRHAVKHVVHQLVKEGTIDVAERDTALTKKAASAVMAYPAIHVSGLVIASEEHPLQGVKHLEAQHVAAQ